MAASLDSSLLIPFIPFIGSSILGILLILFTKTMSRLSKPVKAFLLVCLSSSAIISYLLLSNELTQEVASEAIFDWDIAVANYSFHLHFLLDKAGSIFLSILATCLLILVLCIHYFLPKMKENVVLFVSIGFVGSALLMLPFTEASRTLSHQLFLR